MATHFMETAGSTVMLHISSLVCIAEILKEQIMFWWALMKNMTLLFIIQYQSLIKGAGWRGCRTHYFLYEHKHPHTKYWQLLWLILRSGNSTMLLHFSWRIHWLQCKNQDYFLWKIYTERTTMEYSPSWIWFNAMPTNLCISELI
jgi:hypothetical protein